MGHVQNERAIFFGRNNEQIFSFQKLFILSKYHMFWLSYESFSICVMFFFIKKESFSAKTAVSNIYLSL